MELLGIIAIFALGYGIGKVHGYYSIVKLMKELAEEAGVDLEKELGIEKKEKETVTSVRLLKVDVTDDILYLFDKTTDDFICQAKTIEELAQICKDRKQILLASVLHGEKVFMFVNGVSKEYIE